MLKLNQLRIFFMLQNACVKNPCKNNATCQTGFTTKGYRCLCFPGFTGQDCENGEKKNSMFATFPVCLLRICSFTYQDQVRSSLLKLVVHLDKL